MSDKFRRKKEPKHIRLYASITSSEAWRHLSGNAIKVLLALVARDDGTRNGSIAFSYREAAQVTGMSARTCWRCLIELQDKGFIACTDKGGFNRKVLHSSLWRYTWAAWRGGKPAAPTRDFEKWQPDENSRMQILSEPDANFSKDGDIEASPDANVASGVSREPQKPVQPRDVNSASLIIDQGDRGGAPPTTGPTDSPPRPGGDFAVSHGQVEMWAMPAPVQPPCEQCGAAIASLSRNGLKRFCGEPCRKKAERRRARERRHDKASRAD